MFASFAAISRRSSFAKNIKVPSRRMSAEPKVLSKKDLSYTDAKWITLKDIEYQDQEGKVRHWEVAERKTRGTQGIDAVAILAILRSLKNSFPPSTVIIEQYRPPIDKYVIELPAGLVDNDEGAVDTAKRELEEETGFVADRVITSSPLLVSDPGMTNANMKLVILGVNFDDELVLNEAKLAEGEYITKRVVELSRLYETLEDYERKGFIIDARLAHYAIGYQNATQAASGDLP